MLVNAGVVDDDIERAVLRHRRLHHTDVTDIEADSGRSDLSGKTGCGFDIEIGDHDMSAGFRKAARNRCTDAIRAARDKGAAAIEPSKRPGA